MVYAIAQEIPGVTPELFERITSVLGDSAPEGLIVHASAATPTGLRMVEVWETRDARDAFIAGQVEPAREQVRIDGDVQGEPEHDHFEIESVQRLVVGNTE
jgi:hypothetical protein